MIRILFDDVIKALVQWWKKIWFDARLKARLTMIEWENQWEAARELEEKNRPLYSEKPVDPELQTGESQKLGGEMRLRATWLKE